jgi:hypothetical protein
MAQTYFYHKDISDVRIKVTKKLVIWERFAPASFVQENPPYEWKYNTRHSLPVTAETAERLRDMYYLPEDVVARLKGN